MEFSKKLQAIAPSMTLEIDAKAKKMVADGMDVIGFGAGEPDFLTPQYVVDAAIKALNEGKTKYTPTPGILELRKTICEKLYNDNGISYQPSQIVVSNGAKHSLFNVMQAICNPGDEVILQCPYWVSYFELIKAADAVPVLVNTTFENNFIADPADIEAAVTNKTKAIIVNSPSNPTGAVYTKEQLEEIAQIAIKHDLIIISDEIYEALVYDGTQHISIASLSEEVKERTIVINGLSKAYAMTGWRIGYSASNQKIASIISNYQSHATSNPNSIAQYASMAALKGPKDELLSMVEAFSERRIYMVDRINKIQGLRTFLPKGAFYVFVDISQLFGSKSGEVEINSAIDFATELLNNQQTAVVPGEAFGDKRYIRLSYAVSMEQIKKGLDRIETFVSGLQRG